MKKYFIVQILIISTTYLLTPTIYPAEEEKKLRILVMPLREITSDIPEDCVSLLTDLLSVKIRNLGQFTILNKDDIKATLTEKEFELAIGCDDNMCLLKNVEKLAVNKLIRGEIWKSENRYSVKLWLIDDSGNNQIKAKDSFDCSTDELTMITGLMALKFIVYMESERNPINIKPQVSLRSSYKELSLLQVQHISNMTIRKKGNWGFFGHSKIDHDYEVKTVNGNKVVIDNATGLIWHQSGSSKRMTYNNAKKWVYELNNSGYAGYSDWRLPTVEEAASLLESRVNKNNRGLYIDPIFDQNQLYIWTGDSYDTKAAWNVDFYYFGCVRCYYFHSNFFVRPVRSSK